MSGGVPLRVSRVKNFGPWPLRARSRSMRPVEYMPELQEESAAVRTTKLTMPAPMPRPIFLKASTNGGETPGENSVQGTTERIMISAPT